jgi:endonuclease YncB( thermonuclease family)
MVSGPIEAEVVRVIDGDTVAVRAHIWLGLDMETHVRLAGVDAPEMHASCESEYALAVKARDLVVEALAAGRATLTDIKRDKYGGRVVARMTTADGRDLSALLLKAGLGHPYFGRTKAPWC